MESPIYKLYAIVSAPAIKAMGGNRGRLATQVGHAYVHALWDAEARFAEDVHSYRTQGSAFKVALVADDSQVLRDLAEKYRAICGVSLVEETGSKGDGSVNEAVKGVTALGIGPLRIDLIDDDLRRLKGFV